MKTLRIIFTVLTIAIMCGIFWFSAQPADESTEMSNEVGYIVGRIFVPGFNELSHEEQLAYAESIDYYVRKTAHASEYLLLGVMVSLTLYFWFLESPYLVFFLGWLITVIYAESDEIHQMFVPGRAAMIKDVGIDASGALIGILITALIYSAISRRKAKKK